MASCPPLPSSSSPSPSHPQATGLALPGSDLDIVILGVGAQLARAASGFSPVQRRQLGELLEDLMDAMLKVGGLIVMWAVQW